MIKNWPYLTNEAMKFIKEKGFRIIALNLPSLDREIDGGRTSNHKIFFQNENNLIIESADFSNVPLGNIQVNLVLGDVDAFVDCATCEHLYANWNHN
jgi:kynurenine formamidase